MRITDAAVQAILGVMFKKGLDPKKFFLEIGFFANQMGKSGKFGIAFTQDVDGQILKFGQLTVIVNHDIDTTGVLIDFGQNNGRNGLIFTGEENVSNSNRESNSRS